MGFREEVLTYNQRHQLISEGDRLLVACSGGADSIALLTFLHQQKDFFAIEVGCIHANHGLRGKESDEDECFVKNLCDSWNIKFYSKTLPIQNLLLQGNGNLQDICRRERYHYFDQVMEESNYNKLAVAHHADDQVESVFMGLTRGTRSNGMYAKRNIGNAELIRPLLSVTRKQIEHFLNEQHYTYREDSSNKKDTYTRNRFRHHIVPLVQEENPNVAVAITKWTHQQQQDEQLLNKLSMREYKKIILSSDTHALSIDLLQFQGIEVALQKRVVLLLLNYLYPKESLWLSHSLIEQVHSQCLENDGSSEIHLPNGRKGFRHYSTMLFSLNDVNSATPATESVVVMGQWVTVGLNLRIKMINREEAINMDYGWYVTLNPSELPILVRGRQPGDRLLLKGMKEPKRLSRLMIDEKVPRHTRQAVQLLETHKREIIGVPGVRLGSRFTKQPHEGWTHQVMIEKESH
ncbi:MAG TPA: tRNA lysidine(34) synthetase TilS [Paenisporosarcina sp.]|nr:tRNA lysidine(34) synthetase TilS [Paenisporosarcina sp.]